MRPPTTAQRVRKAVPARSVAAATAASCVPRTSVCRSVGPRPGTAIRVTGMATRATATRAMAMATAIRATVTVTVTATATEMATATATGAGRATEAGPARLPEGAGPTR